MLLYHTGVYNRSRDEALQFYQDFLGFAVEKESLVPAELTEQLFGISRDVQVVLFHCDGIRIEVFICPECEKGKPDFSHLGLLLDNISEVVACAAGAGVEVIVGEIPGKTVYFLKDFSGNMIEIKQK